MIDLRRQIARRIAAEDEARRLALYDARTGLPNRRRLHEEFERRIADLDRSVSKLLAMNENKKEYAERLLVRASGSVYFVKVDTIDWMRLAQKPRR